VANSGILEEAATILAVGPAVAFGGMMINATTAVVLVSDFFVFFSGIWLTLVLHTVEN